MKSREPRLRKARAPRMVERQPDESMTILKSTLDWIKRRVLIPCRSQLAHWRAVRARPSLEQGLILYSDYWGGEIDSTEKPIFILSAGWRSGSTLVQRCVMSGGEAMIWGEPYGPFGLFDALADPIRRLA